VPKPDWDKWKQLVEQVRQPKPSVKIALVGKYVELHDAYMSVHEALKHAAIHLGVEVEVEWVHAVDLEKGKSWNQVEDAGGILVPGGFGSRGVEGKVKAIRYARENKIPFLGLCLGMQLMVVEFGRMALDDESTNSAEFDHQTVHPVIDLMLEQREITDMGGTMRLGLYPCHLQNGTISASLYEDSIVEERHRHRFEFNNEYRKAFEEKGLVYAGLSPDGNLVEIVENKNHPFMVGTQFHPEFLSRPDRPHPLFVGFVRSVCQRMGICVDKVD
jgi:CTP synthase